MFLTSVLEDNVATYITQIHSYSNSIKKTLHHAINITTTEAELFTIRCRINQATQVTNVFHIIIITNTIYLAQHIFDLLNFKTILVILNGLFTYQLAKTWKSSILPFYPHLKYSGTSVRKKNATTLSKIGK